MQKVRVPQFLNTPMAVLWFETDEIVVGGMLFYFAFMVGGWFIYLIAFILLLYYRKLKKVSGRGFMKHLPYILGFKSFEGFPHTFVTKWSE